MMDNPNAKRVPSQKIFASMTIGDRVRWLMEHRETSRSSSQRRSA